MPTRPELLNGEPMATLSRGQHDPTGYVGARQSGNDTVGLHYMGAAKDATSTGRTTVACTTWAPLREVPGKIQEGHGWPAQRDTVGPIGKDAVGPLYRCLLPVSIHRCLYPRLAPWPLRGRRSRPRERRP